MPVTEVGTEGGGGAAHTLARSQQLARWLVGGFSTAEVHHRARELWGVSHRTADRLVAAARAELIRGWDVQRQEMIALLLSRLDSVFREAMAAKNHGAALGAPNSAAKLSKL
jgi:hypothetical protein